MGFLSSLFGGGKRDARFVSEEGYQAHLETQTAMSPQTLEQLRQYEVTDDTELKLEFFFYTDTEAKASALAQELQSSGYVVEHGPSASDKKVFVITGWTTVMPMAESTVVDWTRQMCEVGFKHDCDFDGWGTNPQQE